MYEATGDWTQAKLSFGHNVKSVQLCNMLEEEQADVENGMLTFRPFEIKTVKVSY